MRFLLLSLLRAIFFYLLYVFISFSAFGKWRYYFLYSMERRYEVMERSTQNYLLLPQSLEAEHMGEIFRGSLVLCKKRFWT